MALNFRLLMLFSLFLIGCGKKAETGKFNSDAWKADRFACQDKRRELVPELLKVRSELIGISGGDAFKIFGKPETTALADQAEQLHYYYIVPGPQCDDPHQVSDSNKLIVRINGLGLVSEIGLDQPLKNNSRKQ